MPVDVAAMANGPVALGEALRTARSRIGYSIEAVCNQTSLRPDQIYEIEAGLYEPSPSVLDRLGDMYGIQADQLPRSGDVPRKPPVYDDEKKLLHIAWLTISFDPSQHTNDDLLRSFASCVRKLRGAKESSPVVLREADRHILASLLNLEDTHLDQRFAFWFQGEDDDFAGLRDNMIAMLSGATSNPA